MISGVVLDVLRSIFSAIHIVIKWSAMFYVVCVIFSLIIFPIVVRPKNGTRRSVLDLILVVDRTPPPLE